MPRPMPWLAPVTSTVSLQVYARIYKVELTGNDLVLQPNLPVMAGLRKSAEVCGRGAVGTVAVSVSSHFVRVEM